MAWLHEHATEVQALAAVVTMVFTAALVWVTAKYVRLTATLVQASTAQSERKRLRFYAVVSRLGQAVGDLPEDRDDEKAIRAATLWTDREVTELQSLAPSLGVDAVTKAEKAGMSLRWLLERVRHVKNSADGIETDWRQLPSDGWPDQLKLARESLWDLQELSMPAELGSDHT
jgi:hypothetical protein